MQPHISCVSKQLDLQGNQQTYHQLIILLGLPSPHRLYASSGTKFTITCKNVADKAYHI